MNRLVEIIGKAPSELPFDDVVKQVRLRRARIIKLIQDFRMQSIVGKPRKTGQKKAQASSQKSLEKLLKAEGVSPGELLKLLKEKKA